MENKEEDEMDIEDILLHSLAEGDVDLAGLKNGESTFSITRQGEEKVFEMAGGKDVIEATSKVLSPLIKHGAMGFPVNEDVQTFVLVAMMLKIFKNYDNWGNLIKHLT